MGEDSEEDGAVDWLQGWVKVHGLDLHGECVVGFCQAFEKGIFYKGFKVCIFMNWLMKLVCYYYLFFFSSVNWVF